VRITAGKWAYIENSAGSRPFNRLRTLRAVSRER
jgi:hypothetical protein